MNTLTTPRRPSAPVRQSTDPDIVTGLKGISHSSSSGASTLSSSSPARKRKPVPTPRNTLRKTGPTLQSCDNNQGSSNSSSPEDSGIGEIKNKGNKSTGEDPEDILSALEKIPGVGTLRSGTSGHGSLQSSVAGSLPSLSLDRVKREESTHSLGSSQSSGQQSNKSSEMDGLKEERRRGSSVRSNGISTMADSLGKNRRSSDETTDSAIGTGNSSRLMSTSDSKPSSPVKPFPDIEPSSANVNISESGSPLEASEGPVHCNAENNLILKTDNIEDLYEAALTGRSDSASQRELEKDQDPKDQRLSAIVIQARPLPDLPELKPLQSQTPIKTSLKTMMATQQVDEILTIPSREEELETEGVYSTLLSPGHYSELQPTDASFARNSATITSCQTLNPTRRKLPPIVDDDGAGRFKTLGARKSLQVDAIEPNSTSTLLVKPKRPFMEDSSTNYLTLTGTMMKRKNRKTHPPPPLASPLRSHAQDAELAAALAVAAEDDKTYDVQLTLTSEAIKAMEKRIHAKYHDRCFCGIRRGIHVFFLSLFAFPFALIYSTLQAFYLGTLTWYNVFIHYNEERSCLHKLLSPLILLLYPFWILPCTLFLGIFGGFYQLSWYFDSWLDALQTPDGGFFRWFCEDFAGLNDCSPYRVILLTSSDYERPCTGATNI